MGLIKRDRIQEKGTVLIEKKQGPLLHPRTTLSAQLPPPGKEQVPQAKSEAQRIIESALREADEIRLHAVTEGKEEGRAEAISNIEQSLETLNQAVIERKKIIKDAENEVLRLSIKVAEQIIRSEVSLHRDVCLNIVAEAIARVSDREQLIVRVNREDAEHLKRYKDRLAGILDGVKSFTILEDALVEPGGCVIETNLGFIDAKISTKLHSIEEAMNKVAAEES